MDYFFEAFKKYAVFEGRAGRKEMWMFALFNLIVFFIIVFITQDEKSPLIGIYWLVIIIPWVAVGVRRMHDVDKSGWYFIFPVYNLILALTAGTKGENKYGPEPEEVIKKDGSHTDEVIETKGKESTVIADGVKYCTGCGTKHAKSVKFCSSCGKPFA